MKGFFSALGIVLVVLTACLACAGLLRAEELVLHWGETHQPAIATAAQPAATDVAPADTTAADTAPSLCYWPPHSSTWTFPGRTRDDLIRHLLGGNHGFTRDQLADKTFAQLKAIHSSDHEHKLDRARISPAQPTTAPAPAASYSLADAGWGTVSSTAATGSCPSGSGNCPLNNRAAASSPRRSAAAAPGRAYVGQRVVRRGARPLRFVGRLLSRRCR